MAETTHKEISTLDDDDVSGKRVSGLANRPTNSSGYGSHGLNAAELKARMDAYSDAIREKLNDLIEVFNGADIPLTSFRWGGEDIENLQKLAELLKKPEFTDNLVIHNDEEPSLKVNLKNYITDYKDKNERAVDLAIQAKEAAETAQGLAEEAQGLAETAKGGAETAKTDAGNFALKSEGYAVGDQDGVSVTEGSPYYQNNAKYYAGEASGFADLANTYASNASGSAGRAETSAAEAKDVLDSASEQFAAKLDKKPVGGKDLIDSGTGKIATSYLPDAVLGQVEFQGTFNATTGARNPSDRDFVNHEGYYWICKTKGTKTPDGDASEFEFEVGDWAIILSDGSWDKVDNTDAVASVNDKTGTVVLTGADIKTKTGSPTIAFEIESLKADLLGKLDNSATALWYKLRGEKGISVKVSDDGGFVDISPYLTGATPGQVWTVRGSGEERVAAWEDPPDHFYTSTPGLEQINRDLSKGIIPKFKVSFSNYYYYFARKIGTDYIFIGFASRDYDKSHGTFIPEMSVAVLDASDQENPYWYFGQEVSLATHTELEEKLDNDAMSLASLMQGSKGISVDVNEDETYVDVHPDMTGATPGQVWMVNEAGDSAKWADFEGGAFTPVQYGVTTYAEITAIIQSGKVPVLKHGNSVLYYNGVESGTGAYQFFSVLLNTYSEKATCSTSSVWSNFGQSLEQDVNKTATIGASSTDTQYPTAKATYTALNDIRKVAEGKCTSYTVDETLTIDSIKSVLSGSPIAKAYYNGTDITESVLEGSYDYLVHNTDFVSSSESINLDIDSYIVVAIPASDSYVFYKIDDMHTGDVLYVIGTGYPDRWVSEPPSGGASKTLYTLETVRKEAVGRTVTIQPSQWSNNTATVTVMGVTATNIVICDASDPDVQATAQNTNTLTFTCTKTPTVSVTVKVVIL